MNQIKYHTSNSPYVAIIQEVVEARFVEVENVNAQTKINKNISQVASSESKMQ